MTCRACTDFNSGGNISFDTHCLDCKARSIATSPAWKAFCDGWPAALRGAVERQFSGDVELGMRMVRAWAEKLKG